MPSIFEIMNAAVKEFTRDAPARAEALCRRVLDAVPEQPDALFLQAVIARRALDHEHAEALIRRCSAGRRSLDRQGFDAGVVLNALTRCGDPLGLYRAVLRLQPADSASHLRLAQELLQQDEPRAALELCHAVTAGHGPGAVAVGRLTGTAQQRLGLCEAAVETLAAALQRSPDDSELRYQLACALRETGREQDAATHLREVLRRDPDREDARRALAAVERGR